MEGDGSKAIALLPESLAIAEAASRRHVANIHEKTGAVNRGEATGYALRERLLFLDETQTAHF